MRANVAGRVENTKLPTSHALAPLYEAIMNSVHSIQERAAGVGHIQVRIVRDPAQQTLKQRGNSIPDVTAIEVTDDGVGFDSEHFESFDTLDSRAKAQLGGKGMGRVFWLKAFEFAQIASVYQEDGKKRLRKFNFQKTERGVEPIEDVDAPSDAKVETTVRLVGFFERYRNAAPKSGALIAFRIVEHCLEHFALNSQSFPRITLHDQEEPSPIDLLTLFRAEFVAESQVRAFAVGDYQFEILDVMVRRPQTEHRLTFCAHRRAVLSTHLVAKIPLLQDELHDAQGGSLAYLGYVSGKYLDNHVNSDRAGFDIGYRGELKYTPNEIPWEDIEEASLAKVTEYLAPQLERMRTKSLERVREFVRTTEPRYGVLLGKRAEAIAQLPSTLSENQLDVELHKLLHAWKLEVRQEARTQLAVVSGPDDFELHRKAFEHAISELQDAAKSELADYVVHRATVLSFFEKLLGALESGKFPKEEALHRVIFPLRRTSHNTDYEDHNLWILDERLVYHHYLASDLSFRQQDDAPIQVESDERPDLIVYDRPFAYTPGDTHAPSTAVVIFEFKRPERTDYADDASPIAQVLRYVERIRSGRAKRPDNSTLEAVPEHMPFYCYIVATLNNKLRQEARERSFIEMPDGQGYFFYNSNYRAYIEVLSYRKVLSNAKMRNKVFFDKLQFPSR